MSFQNTKTPAMVLQEFTVKHGYSPPEYILVLSKTGSHENEFHYKVNVAHICAPGFGRSKQVAKHDAATKALEILAERGLYDPQSNPAQEFNAQAHRNESDNPMTPSVNFIGSLKDICCENKLPPPNFIEISDVGPPHCREFTFECCLASIRTQATANTKKQAKQLAAKDMLAKIEDVFPSILENLAGISNALTDLDHEAAVKYNDISGDLFAVIPNRSVVIDNYCLSIKKLMIEKNLKFEDFHDEFKEQTEDGLSTICNQLDLKHKIAVLQEEPFIVHFWCSLDTPFTILGFGGSFEEAKVQCIQKTYDYLSTYMTIPNSRVK